MANEIDQETRRRLREAFLQANASISLEGMTPDEEILQLQQKVIDGRISIDDAIRFLTIEAQRN